MYPEGGYSAMFTLPDLSYAYNALEPFIDEQTMHIHHDKHHAGYVKNLNDALVGQDALLSMSVNELIKDLRAIPESLRTKVKNNAGGHANHSLFWEIMSPVTPGVERVPFGDIAKAINTTFGSFTAFQSVFSAGGMGRFGSGWVWLVMDNRKLTILDTPNQDSPLSEGKTPLLTLDVWEHAYYLKYQNMRADYIKAWWNVVNWAEVEKRYHAAI